MEFEYNVDGLCVKAEGISWVILVKPIDEFKYLSVLKGRSGYGCRL